MEMSVGYYERVAMIGRPHDFQAGHEFGDRFGGQGQVDLGEGISVACWHCHQPVGKARQDLGFAVCFRCEMDLLKGQETGESQPVVLAEDHEKEMKQRAVRALAVALEKALFR